MPAGQLIVFVKAPRPGQVKTRLARSLGAAAACAAYRQLVETLLGRIGGWPDAELCHAPDEAAAEIRPWLKPGWTLAPQGGGELGERMQRAFARHWQSGASRAVILGSDCPWVNEEDIGAAFDALRRHEVVLGPASDGGYWLIGLRAPQPALFEGIAWSTAAVLNQTLAQAQAVGLRVHLLRALSDVDTEEDWRSFLSRKAALVESATG